MTIVPIDRRIRLSEQAYDALRAMIVSGELAPGTQLSEAELSEHLEIGRTPLREALLKLAAEGLVVIYPQSGSFVAPISLEAVEEAQFMREHLECAVIREVAARVDERGIDALRQLLAQQEAAFKAGDADRFYELDEELHATFSSIARRPAVWRIIHQSKVHLDRVRRLSLPVADQIPRLIQQHRSVVEAIALRDVAAAEAALRVHLREVFATVKSLGLDKAELKIKLPRRRRES